MQSSEMQLPLLILVYIIAVQISFCAEIRLENVHQTASNISLTTEIPQKPEDGLIANLSATEQPTHCTCMPYYLCADNDYNTKDGHGISRPKPEPCKHYLDICCTKVDSYHVDRLSRPRRIVRRSNYGQPNVRGIGFKRSTNYEDTEAKVDKFPWMVAIRQAEPDQNETYQCGGSLIHRQAVLTAAHCVVGKGPKQLKARAGEWKFEAINELYPHQDSNVKEIVVHENYHAGELRNNIAILIMDIPFEIEENIDLISLPDEGEIMDGRQCVVSGWEKGGEGRYKGIMKKVEFPIGLVPKEICVEALNKTILRKNFKLHKSLICIGGGPSKGTWKSDLGIPLACPSRDNPHKYIQAGIFALGTDYGKSTPGVYVNVPSFREWITSKLKSYNLPL